MNEFADDPLARRLAALDIARPDPAAVVGKVLERRTWRATHSSRGWLLPLIAVSSALAVVASALLATYLSPRLAQALADEVPPAAGLLQRAWLANVSGRVSSFDDSARSAGYEVRLVGGYADQLRTVLLLKVSPAGPMPLAEATLSDQFGRSYRGQGGFADMNSGDAALTFAPVEWPASITGARLTLRIAALRRPPAEGDGFIRGDWQLHATLAVDEARDLALPSSQSVGDVTFEFVAIRVTPNALLVELDASPTSSRELGRLIPGDPKPQQAFVLKAYGPTGEPLRWFWTRIGPGSRPDHALLTAVFGRGAPGIHRIVISLAGKEAEVS